MIKNHKPFCSWETCFLDSGSFSYIVWKDKNINLNMNIIINSKDMYVQIISKASVRLNLEMNFFFNLVHFNFGSMFLHWPSIFTFLETYRYIVVIIDNALMQVSDQSQTIVSKVTNFQIVCQTKNKQDQYCFRFAKHWNKPRNR